MFFNYSPVGLMGLLLSCYSLSVQAQSVGSAASPVPAAIAPAGSAASAQAARYTVAHDSLMQLAAGVRAQAEARMVYFTSSYGSLGGLRSRVRSYSNLSMAATSLVKEQTTKHRFGKELKKVAYFDANKRKVLLERYEGRELTRLELFEYFGAREASATSHWLLVQDQYLQHDLTDSSISSTGERKNKQLKSSYFFKPQPTTTR